VWKVPAFSSSTIFKHIIKIRNNLHSLILELEIILYFLAVKRLKIIRHLEQVETEEDGSAVFSCELSHESPSVQWLLNDRVLYTNHINKVQNSGKVYSLILKRLAPQESRVTFKTFDISESAFLRVRGKVFSYRGTKKTGFFNNLESNSSNFKTETCTRIYNRYRIYNCFCPAHS